MLQVFKWRDCIYAKLMIMHGLPWAWSQLSMALNITYIYEKVMSISSLLCGCETKWLLFLSILQNSIVFLDHVESIKCNKYMNMNSAKCDATNMNWLSALWRNLDRDVVKQFNYYWNEWARNCDITAFFSLAIFFDINMPRRQFI